MPLFQFANLNRKEKMVIDLVTKNPGITKQGVVNALEGRLSRATVFITLAKLENLMVIRIKKDRPNSQVHKLFINNDSLLMTTIQTLDRFETLYFSLLDKMRPKFEHKKKGQVTNIESQDLDIIAFCLFSIYMEFLRIYMSKALILWPQKASNRNLLNRLHLMLFSVLVRIQLTLSNTLPITFISYHDINDPENPEKLYSFDNSFGILTQYIVDQGKEYGIEEGLNKLKLGLLRESKESPPLIPTPIDIPINPATTPSKNKDNDIDRFLYALKEVSFSTKKITIDANELLSKMKKRKMGKETTQVINAAIAATSQTEKLLSSMKEEIIKTDRRQATKTNH